jgi:hypothetical protein
VLSLYIIAKSADGGGSADIEGWLQMEILGALYCSEFVMTLDNFIPDI